MSVSTTTGLYIIIYLLLYSCSQMSNISLDNPSEVYTLYSVEYYNVHTMHNTIVHNIYYNLYICI